MKIVVKVAIMESYSTIGGESVEIDVDELDNPMQVQQALDKALVLASEKGMFKSDIEHAMTLFIKMREKQIRDKADKEAKLVNGEQKETWKLRAELEETQKKLRMKDCQLDGIIKSVNPDYVPVHEQEDPKTL